MSITRSLFKHYICLHVRWGDADALGHINNTEFIRYLESSRIDYFQSVLNIELTKGINEGWVLADMQCSYLQQVHFPCELEVAMRFTKLGNSSAEIQAVIFRKGEDTPVATSKSISVWFDYFNQGTKRIPDNIRQAITEFEQQDFT